MSLTIQETATETYAWNNLGLAFFSPLCYLGIDLVSKLRFDFTGIAGEEREETLSSAVDNVDFVQRYRYVQLLFAFGFHPLDIGTNLV